jgi:taurine dioxygenase
MTQAVTVQAEAVSPFSVHPIAARLAGEVRGCDLSAPLTRQAHDALRRSILDHPVLVFRGQALTPAQLLALGEAFGRPQPHTILQYRHAEFPALSWVTNVDQDGKVDDFGAKRRAVAFHADGSFKPVPEQFTILHGMEVPSVGGPTIFADMYLAYEALSPAMQRRLDGLTAMHRRGGGPAGERINGVVATSKELQQKYQGASHPIVRPHPETGRKALYVNPLHTAYVENMAAAEGDALLESLHDHCARPEYHYSHQWRQGDVVMWDQRCTLHRAGGGTPAGERRVFLRTILALEDA